ncbi:MULTISPECIES: PilZN3 domain-containing protein [unclassified Oceanispirochaeta]|uniref:PilZN3 domain-containing protein n=1 Tax=unclassified Oceanispirochaeta TaxID=2635722 RepID=UPI000E099BE4|nr:MULTISPECIES: PilZN3 domain-containing protein [unclassified Oceanispirochaeta]MBF9014834.1 pilus assembly protein PilZ [Oceanispirochaeta sp. M2]NPD71090.1 pilus assembly protein PilZ [Oceanispirochaeta sp. M1]RDG33922.1 pilus assembly protein PilZ [Oceanispirochaeta sp. M1]
MAIVTNQTIKELFNRFRSIEVTFNKEVSKATGLQPRKIFLKFKESARPCILYASSMEAARVIVSLPTAILQNLKENESNVALKLSFIKDEQPKPIELNFFIQGRLSSFTRYSDDQPDVYFCSINFSTQPPDDLIETLGFLLEANVNATKRKEERALVTTESMKRLDLGSKNCVVIVDNIPRKGILRDLSFSGSKVIIQGNAKFLVNKVAVLRILNNRGESITISGTILRFEEVQGRRDLAALALHFTLEALPLSYKVMINNFILHR